MGELRPRSQSSALHFWPSELGMVWCLLMLETSVTAVRVRSPP